jgi:hypothetical protein
MALVRCKRCGRPEGRTQTYVIGAEPVGYPDTAAVCGLSGCENPGLVWLNRGERRAFLDGKRIFSVPSAAVKIKVTSRHQY